MSLYDRVTRFDRLASALPESWDQQAPYGVPKIRRKEIGIVPLPLGRKPRKGEVVDPELFEEVRLIEAVDPQVKTLYIFDMDGTLIHQPTPEQGRRKWKEATGKEWPHKAWWSVAQTLRAPFKIEVISSTKSAFTRAKKDRAGKVVVMTGRIASPEMKKTIPALLHRLGLGTFSFGDNLFLKRINAPDTVAWKLSMLDNFAKRFPNLERVEMWEDRAAHVGEFRARLKKLGLEGNVHHVQEKAPAHIAAERSLYGRVVLERFPNSPWWNMRHDPFEPHEVPPKKPKQKPEPAGTTPEEPEQPIENPLPGNVSPRTANRAQGTRLQRMRGPRPPR